MPKKMSPDWRSKSYSYKKPLDPGRFLMGDQVITDLMSTRAFQRLQKVRFLGGIDYVIVRSPNGSRPRYNRYQHSLGVAQLASIYSEKNELCYDDRRIVCIAALLHDIGHAPLSHSLESKFYNYFGIDHHIATEEIIKGECELGREVFEKLKWNNINIERLLHIINGHEKSFSGFFSGPINFDTIEGILRSYSYARNNSTTPKPDTVTLAATERTGDIQRQIVDTFWKYKDLVYKTIINSREGILADTVCQNIMIKNVSKFSKSDFYTDEIELFKKIPELKDVIFNKNFLEVSNKYVSYPIEFKDRRFFINEECDFYTYQDDLRYSQTKTLRNLVQKTKQTIENTYRERDLFDDNFI